MTSTSHTWPPKSGPITSPYKEGARGFRESPLESLSCSTMTASSARQRICALGRHEDSSEDDFAITIVDLEESFDWSWLKWSANDMITAAHASAISVGMSVICDFLLALLIVSLPD